MQRLFRSGGINPNLLRRIHRVHGTEGGQEVTIQRVKITRKLPWKRWIAFTVAVPLCGVIYKAVVLAPLEQALMQLPRPKDDELDPVFFPFPFTTKKIDPEPYAGNDPEWEEFVRMARDKSLQKQMRDDLANFVKREAERAKWLKERFGNSFKIRRHWLDVDYPSKPAPEFEISGLLFTPKGCEWAAIPVDSAVVNKQNRTLWPKAAFLSTGAFVGALVKQNVDSVRDYFGIPQSSSPTVKSPGEQPPPPSHSPEIQKALQKLRQQTTQRPDEVKDPRTLAKTTASEADTASSETQQQQQPKQQQASSDTPLKAASAGQASKGLSSDEASKEKFMFHSEIKSMIGQKPWDAFKKKLIQTWRPQNAYPPRGSVLVSGFIELEGKRGYVVIDVLAWYNPKTKKYDQRSTIMKIRRIQMKVQHPRG